MDNRLSFRCVCIGEASLLIQCSQHLLQKGHEIIALVTDAGDYVEWGAEQRIDVLPYSNAIHEQLAHLEFDYLFSIANLKILSAELLALPRQGAFNFHDALLPQYAGLYTTSWSIINQEAEHGVTWHMLEAGIDTGEIVAQERFSLDGDETAFSLNVKCYAAGMRTFGKLVRDLESGSLAPRSQTIEKRTYFAKHRRPPFGAILDWRNSADRLDALVRGLDFGQTENPLSLPKLFNGVDLFAVSGLKGLTSQSDTPPGTVLALNGSGIMLSTGSKDVQISRLHTLSGEELWPAQIADTLQLEVGHRLPYPDKKRWAGLEQTLSTAAKHESKWVAVFDDGLVDIEMPYLRSALTHAPNSAHVIRHSLIPRSISKAEPAWLLAAFGVYLSRLTNQDQFHLLLQIQSAERHPLFSPFRPVLVSPLRADAVGEEIHRLQNRLRRLLSRPGYFRDLFLRYPSLSDKAHLSDQLPLSCGLLIDINWGDGAQLPDLALGLGVDQDRFVWRYDPARIIDQDVDQIQAQFETFLAAVTADESIPLDHVPILNETQRQAMLFDWNETGKSYRRDVCIHTLFEEQVNVYADQTAVTFQGEALTYAELDRLSNQVARYLISLGVGPDQMIGVYMDRSLEMIIGLFGILKAGGAYLPLDPIYPAERLAFMVADTNTPVILTQLQHMETLPPHTAKTDIVVLDLNETWGQFDGLDSGPVLSPATAENLAYIIYTSGSTGKPKGVMVEHRNAINFFSGMDDRIPHQAGDTWLAVTSLSFDISVLELFWSLTRGLHVVLYSSRAPQKRTALPNGEIDFGLFYFSSDASEDGVLGKYDLLLEGARFADAHGFSSVWTPERHFDAFGGLYPNPAVTGAAVAAVTERVRILAGSCVLPLHHPVRVAEEWAVVDNISNGRVGISFAAGWQPNDFLLQPDNFENRKGVMFEQIETVKKLWRGESVSFEGPTGPVIVETLPRPVQLELPIWVTAAGNPETFRMAGEGGFHILTHLLGQSVAEVGEKIAVYRDGWRKSGRPGDGHVTIMLHTFVGDDPDIVRDLVREPLIDYLRSSLFLIKKASWSFPTFKEKGSETGQSPLEIFESQDLTDEEMAALLEHAFDRYYEESGLLGTPEKCRDMVSALSEIGVDEIACQIDFGVSSSLVLNHLPFLNELRQVFQPTGHRVEDDLAKQTAHTIPELIKAYGVTHFQCTPSMMRMLLLDDEMKGALPHLNVCMLGGEGLPRVLADEVLESMGDRGRLINMYGPTETTIWSSTEQVLPGTEMVTIGRPIANTALYIVDEQLQPLPMGVPGELLIGGDGVVRGYWGREQLTAERFILDPFKQDGQSRLYRTGDLARFLPDGRVDFLGRLDFQVKIRGYRIELGEIESLLNGHHEVREAVVVAREDRPGDKRLVAYILGRNQFKDEAALRAHLKETLPDFMVPGHFLFMSAFPLTPNKKTDRKALPSPFTFSQNQAEHGIVDSGETNHATPQTRSRPAARSAVPKGSTDGPSPLEGEIAAIWKELLGLDSIGRHDNFFDIGGHSILAVQAHRQMCETLQVDLSIADLFRYATLAELDAFLSDQRGMVEEIQQQALDRVTARRNAMGHRVRGRRTR